MTTSAPTPPSSGAVQDHIANSALIKVNEIGTITEPLEAMAICHKAGYTQMSFTAPGRPPTPSSPTSSWPTGAGQIKTGSPARGERVAKYDRLIEIAADHPDLPYGLA